MYFFTFLTTTCDPAFTVNSITPTLRINDALKCVQFYFPSLRITKMDKKTLSSNKKIDFAININIWRLSGALKFIISTGKALIMLI